MTTVKLVLLALLSTTTVTSSYNILAIFPHNGKSHFDVFKVLLNDLVRKGHNLTVVSYFPRSEPIPNYEDISLMNNGSEILLDVLDMTKYTSDAPRVVQCVEEIYEFAIYGVESCKETLTGNQKLIDLINSGRKYDVVILEMFARSCFMGFAHVFKAPLIGISSTVVFSWDNKWFANPENPSYLQTVELMYSSRPFSFWDRLENFGLSVIQNLIILFVRDGANNRIAKEFFGNDSPNLEEIGYNMSLFMTYTHHSLHAARPYVPAMIEVGGFHVGKPKTLPKNIEKWINESTHGVIYFSLGSMIKGHTFPEEKRQMFLKAFARLPQRVLWKWEKEMPGKPDNVMIQKWMPQFDILNHPNVKAFISHGGLLGTTEAVHCGVPMVIMPQYGDQFANARAVEISGGGVMLDFTTITEDIIYDALKKVLSSEFNTKAKDLSERFRDRPLPPLETAVYWVEYVARHKGAPHMRTAAVGMPLYQYLLLDVIAFLLVVFIVIIYSLYFVLKRLLRLFIKPKSKQKLKSN